MSHFTRLLNSIYPGKCLLCHEKIDPNQRFCCYCHQTLPFITTACYRCAAIATSGEACGRCLSNPPYFERSLSVFKFTEPINSFIYKFKYNQQFYLGESMSLELVNAIMQANPCLPDIVVPVPLHRRRLRQRGFNQSALIARHVAKKLRLPCKNNYLIRQTFSRPQIELNAKQRELAVKNAFCVNSRRQYQHIALIDDVVSTTHTVNQAAKALKQAGTATVCVWSLARNT